MCSSDLFGESHIEEATKKYGLKVLAHGPLDPQIAFKIDKGCAEDVDAPWLDPAADEVEVLLKK